MKKSMEQDRVALIMSYAVMCKTFRVKKPISRAQMAAMGNQQLLQLCKDLYNGAPLKLAKRFQRKMEPKQPLTVRIRVACNKLYIKLRLRKALHA